MSQGKLDVQIYSDWGISKDTFYQWMNEHEELKEAHQIGMAKCESWYAQKAQQALEDRDDKGFKYFIAIMNNKFNWEKGSPKEVGTTNIQVGNIQILQQKSRDGLIDFIKNSLNRNNELIDVKLIEDTKFEPVDGQGTSGSSPESSNS